MAEVENSSTDHTGLVLPDGGTSLPRVIVYDPAQGWHSLASRVVLPAGINATLNRNGASGVFKRLEQGSIPDADVLLAIVPDRGFDRSAARALEEYPPSSLIPRVFLAVVDDEMLKPVSRGGFGFEHLHEEITREQGAPLVFVRPGVDAWLLEDALSIALRRASNSAVYRDDSKKVTALVCLAVTFLSSSANAESLSAVEDLFCQVDMAQALTMQLQEAIIRAEKHFEDGRLLDEEWRRLAQRSLDKCLAAARGATIHGIGAEDVIRGLADRLPEIEATLTVEFGNPPDDSLQKWAERLRVVVDSPEIVLPVVGVFSSGKTTLINHLLGPSPGGHALLRTSRNHNTALLTRFCRGTPERVRLTWRSDIDLELMWHGDVTTRPILAATDGKIEKLESLGDGHLVTLRTQTGDVRWVHLDERHHPLPGIRPGKHVHAGEALSEGIDANAEALGLLKESPSTELTIRPWAIASILRFLDTGLLFDVQLDLRWRQRRSLPVPGSPPFEIRQATLKDSDPEYRDAISAMKEIVRGKVDRLSDRIPVPMGRSLVPIALRFQAKVRKECCEPKEHPLTDEEGWTWFQGPADERGGEGSERHRGFAESAEAAWLIEQADLFVNSPLFRLASIVDTPGLDSISEHHDRITEDCIGRGQAFLVMTRLGHSTFSVATERTFHMIVQSFLSQRVPRNQMSGRVFVVLNWFRRDVGAHTEDQARDSARRFEERLRYLLGAERLHVYVVELSPSRLRENPEEILGFPSLAALKRDLRSYLGVHGIAVRLRSLRNELEPTLARLEKDWREQLAGLGAGSDEDIKALRRVIARLDVAGTLRTDLHEKIDEAIDSIDSPWKTLRHELKRDYDGKSDFENAKDVGVNTMTAYNSARNDLRNELFDEIDGSIAAVVRTHVVTAPHIRRCIAEIESLPVAPVDGFSRDVSKIISEWPGGWRRFWHVVTNFEYHATTERQKLINRYIQDEATKSIKVKCEKIRDALTHAVAEVLDGLVKDLHKRLADKQADANRIAARRTEIDEQLRHLANFRPSASRMSRTLERVIADIEGLKN